MISLVAGPIAAVIRSFDQLRRGSDELMRGLENFNATMENLNETAATGEPAAQRVRRADPGDAPQLTRTMKMADELSMRLAAPIDQVVPGLSRLAETLNSPICARCRRDLGQFMEVINDLGRRMLGGRQARRPGGHVPDPTISEPDDAIVRITSTGLCGSDLHLYEVMGPFMTPGDILGHEPMGVVEEVGAGVTASRRATGSSSRSTSPAATAGCATGSAVAVRDHPGPRARQGSRPVRLHQALRPGAGGQAEFLRVPQAQYGPIKVPEGRPTTGSSTSPTSCPRPGRPCSTPPSRRAAPSSCSAWADRRHGLPVAAHLGASR